MLRHYYTAEDIEELRTEARDAAEKEFNFYEAITTENAKRFIEEENLESVFENWASGEGTLDEYAQDFAGEWIDESRLGSQTRKNMRSFSTLRRTKYTKATWTERSKEKKITKHGKGDKIAFFFLLFFIQHITQN